eukprot:scaffold106065_cov35-Attheya_sp.AAC.1
MDNVLKLPMMSKVLVGEPDIGTPWGLAKSAVDQMNEDDEDDEDVNLCSGDGDGDDDDYCGNGPACARTSRHECHF